MTSINVPGKALQATQPSNRFLKQNYTYGQVVYSQAQYDSLAYTLDASAGGAAGAWQIFYQAGDYGDRVSRIVVDPVDINNRCLAMSVTNPVIPDSIPGTTKGRVQMSLPDVSFTSLFYEYRVLLGSGFTIAKEWEETNAIYALGEHWQNKPWLLEDDAGQFKLSLTKSASPGSQDLLLFGGQTYTNSTTGEETEYWSQVDTRNFPVGEWVRIRVGLESGDAENGRALIQTMYAADNGVWHTVAYYTGITHNPTASAPVPFTILQPLKLYGRGTLIDDIRTKGDTFALIYDDLEMWVTW
jgi:hypothetical protein